MVPADQMYSTEINLLVDGSGSEAQFVVRHMVRVCMWAAWGGYI